MNVKVNIFLDLCVVIASLVVISVGSEGQVFAASAIRYVQYMTNIVQVLYPFYSIIDNEDTKHNFKIICDLKMVRR